MWGQYLTHSFVIIIVFVIMIITAQMIINLGLMMTNMWIVTLTTVPNLVMRVSGLFLAIVGCCHYSCYYYQDKNIPYRYSSCINFPQDISVRGWTHSQPRPTFITTFVAKLNSYCYYTVLCLPAISGITLFCIVRDGISIIW